MSHAGWEPGSSVGRAVRAVAWCLRMAHLHITLPVTSGAWLMAVFAFTIEPSDRRNEVLGLLGLPSTLVLATCVSFGLCAYALILNDILDWRHDQVFNRDKPLAAGRISLRWAMSIATVCLLMAIGVAVFLGTLSAMMALAATLGIVIYNTIGKHLPAAGIVLLGLIFALNMLIVNPVAGFLWPVWLCMTHVMSSATVLHLIQNKRPRLRPIDCTGVIAGWLFWTMALMGIMQWRDAAAYHETPWLWLGPAAGIILSLAVTGAIISPPAHHGKNNDAPTRHRRIALMSWWSIMFINTGWLAGQRQWLAAGLVLLVTVAAAACTLLASWLENLHRIRPAYDVTGSVE